MGKIRDIINTVDSAGKASEEVKESLKILMELAESKATVFEQAIKNDLLTDKVVNNLSVPVTKVIASRKEFRAKTPQTTSDVVDNISNSLNSIFGGNINILTGISSLLGNVLETLLGTAEGEESELRLFYVVAEYPAIVRFDFAFWSRSIKAKAIREMMENVFACVAFKSAVDIKKLEFSDFLAMYGTVLNKAFENESDLKHMIEESQEIYDMLTQKNSANFFVGDTSIDSALSIVKSNANRNFIIEQKTYKAIQGDF